MQVKGTPKVANPEGWLEGCFSCLTLIQVSSVATLSLWFPSFPIPILMNFSQATKWEYS